MTNHAIRAVMAANGGLLTWAEARDGGLTSAQLRHLVREGALVVLRRGLYVDGELWRSLDPYRDQHRLRTRAVIKGLKRGFVISHDSAAHEHGLEIVLPPVPFTHITRRGSTTAWSRNGVKHHYADFEPDQVTVLDGLEVLDLARTAVDIARENGEPYGEIACDAAMRAGITRAALEEACASMISWPHIQRTRRAVAFADPGAQTPIETMGRLLVEELGVGAVETQFPFPRENGRVGWADMRVGCHLFETHGKIKFLPPEQGGVAERPVGEVAWELRKRDHQTFREGLGTSHIYWEDCWPPQRATTLKRLREEYDDTVRRFGTRLPERLERFAREARGEARA
jgi:predicted transcriptional regulator of viral defense system